MHIPKLYLKGSFNGWGLDTPFTQTADNQWQTTLSLTCDRHAFKIADQEGVEKWTMSADATQATLMKLQASQALMSTLGIGNDLHFEATTSQRYTFTLNYKSSSFFLTIEQAKDNQEIPLLRAPFSANLPLCSIPDINIEQQHNACLPLKTLFSELAITKKNSFKFVFGDNVDGYYEGCTHQFVNAGKYRHHRGWYLGGSACFINGTLLNKTNAHSANLLPYGIEHSYRVSNKVVSETFSLLSEKRVAAFHLQSATSANLALVPELNIAADGCQLEQFDHGILISLNPELCPEGSPSTIAITASTAFNASEVNFEQLPELNTIVNLSGQNLKLQLSTLTPQQNVTFYICFAQTAEQAIALATNARITHAYQQHQTSLYRFLCRNYLWTNNTTYNKALMWARLASRTFVSNEFGKGIWAGLPWFKDCWGRDTFIALSGTSLINAKLEEAKSIINNFAAMQMTDNNSIHYGRIPNRVTSKINIIYNTTDGTPWMVKEILEYINYSGDLDFAKAIYPIVKHFIEGVKNNYLDADGLMTHRDPDTWMDAKINGQIPWSPRGNKANDIQALWFESLNSAIVLAKLNDDLDAANTWITLAQQVKKSFTHKFWDSKRALMADRIDASGSPDFSVRPNQLMTLSIPQTKPLVDDSIGVQLVKNAVSALLFPWGICSLEQSHENYHPYHDAQANYHKDAAYHNGTIWGWNAGFTISGLARYQQQDLAFDLSLNLAQQILNQGHLGTMSENLNAYQDDPSNLIETGTYAQAWSVSEYARNAQQDYLGYKPQLSRRKVLLQPKLPSAWSELYATLPIGKTGELQLSFHKQANIGRYQLHMDPSDLIDELAIFIDTKQKHRLMLRFDVSQGLDLEINLDTKGALKIPRGEDQLIAKSTQPLPDVSQLAGLGFALPNKALKHQCMREPDYLLNKINQSQAQVAKD